MAAGDGGGEDVVAGDCGAVELEEAASDPIAEDASASGPKAYPPLTAHACEDACAGGSRPTMMSSLEGRAGE